MDKKKRIEKACENLSLACLIINSTLSIISSRVLHGLFAAWTSSSSCSVALLRFVAACPISEHATFSSTVKKKRAHKAGEKYNIYKQSIYHILQRYLHDDNDGVLSLTLFWNVTFSAMLLIWPVSMKV